MWSFLLVLGQKTNEKFNRIYKTNHEFLLYCAFKILNSKEQAEDVVQETFLRAWKNLDKMDEANEKKVRSFLYAIMKNVSITAWNKAHAVYLDSFDEYSDSVNFCSDFDSTWITVDAHLLREDLVEIIRKLKILDQELFRMAIFEENTYAEVAGLVGLTEKNVSVRLSRMKHKIRAELAKRRDDSHEFI